MWATTGPRKEQQMTDDVIPDDLRDFMLRYINSIAQLEALLLLRANSHQQRGVLKASRRLYASEPAGG